MATPWTITVDCADAPRQAVFWAEALGYVPDPPPEGWATWEAWLRDHHVPPEEWSDGAGICDPDGVLPSLGFLRVPEVKSAKNRFHLDLQVSSGRHLEPALRTERIEAMVSRLVGVGGTVVARHRLDDQLDHVVMADPEGNELCVV